jgi:hypothetical protein
VRNVREKEIREVLMILQPRAIPEAIESLNSLDIEKVWFRGMSEATVCNAMNNFVQNTDYDFYWIIADDVVVDDEPLQCLRPLLYEGNVVTGYCKMSMASKEVNLLKAPMNYSHYKDSDHISYLRSVNHFKPNTVPLRKDIEDDGVGDENWWGNLVGDLGAEGEIVYSLQEVQEMDTDVFRTYFAGWSFTGASRDVWIKYPFIVSILSGQSDTQFALRFVNRDEGVIYTHKDAYFTHLKEVDNDFLNREWLVGVETPIIHSGDGKISANDIRRDTILWKHDTPEVDFEGLLVEVKG